MCLALQAGSTSSRQAAACGKGPPGPPPFPVTGWPNTEGNTHPQPFKQLCQFQEASRWQWTGVRVQVLGVFAIPHPWAPHPCFHSQLFPLELQYASTVTPAGQTQYYRHRKWARAPRVVFTSLAA